MYEADIRGVCIIPIPPEFRPDSMVTELAPAYLSDEFMEFMRLTADHAASKGMVMWLYDEGGWPSGGAGGLVAKKLPKMGRKQLKVRKVCLSCGQKYNMPEDCKAAFVGGVRIRNGFKADVDMEISEYCLQIVSGFFSDVSEPEAVELFLKLTHDRYREYLGEHMGKTIPLMFTDEPFNPYPCFCYGFEEKFREKYGYDILDIGLTAVQKERSSFFDCKLLFFELIYRKQSVENKKDKNIRMYCKRDNLVII